MSWGGLNRALTAWRNAVERRFPGRGRASDGARADAAHGSTSQHQEDSDGTVDAFDMDVNLLDSGEPSGTSAERRLIEAMKLDFERDPRSRGQLWIHQREIANRDIGNWRKRAYGGQSPHDKHVHWESRQSREDDGSEWPMPHTDALLREMRGDDVNQQELEAAVRKVLQEEMKNGAVTRERVEQATVSYAGGPFPDGRSLGHILNDTYEAVQRLEGAVQRLEAAGAPAARGARAAKSADGK